MSRRISNPKLAALLKASQMALHDLAAIVGVHRTNLLLYSLGKPRPILERKLARHMKITIPELRGLLGLDYKQNRRKSHATIAAEMVVFKQAVESLSADKSFKIILNRDNGRNRWVNGGAQFASNPEMLQRIRDNQNVPHLKIIRWRTGMFQTVRVINTHRRRKPV